MKSILKIGILGTLLTLSFGTNVFAQTSTYTVQKGDTLWIISKKYEVGISEIIEANEQFENPNLIYPGDTVYIPSLDESVTSTQEEILSLVNKERKNQGLSTVELDWQVSRVAQTKSEDMANNNYFSHTSPTYGTPFQMLKSFNISYKTAGENIAKGQKTASSVMNSWMNSSGHKANILGSSYTRLGVGYYIKNGTTYWTQIFIS